MARQPLIRTSDYPYHVTGRSNNKEWFPLAIDGCWTIFEKHLAEVSQKMGAKIVSFVLMSNHFHMILWTPYENLDRIMNQLLKQVSRSINKKSDRINHIFGTRYHWSLIQTEEYFSHVYRYVYQNPLVKGLCDRVENYPYSTLYKIFRNLNNPYSLHDTEACLSANVVDPINQKMEWLNRRYSDSELEIIRLGLRRTVFNYPKHKRYQRIVTKLCRK